MFLDSLQPNEVKNCFINDLVSIQPDNERLQKFTEYLLKNYIQPNAKFPPKLWSAFKPSTYNKNYKRIHIHLFIIFNAMFYSAHTNIYIYTHINLYTF